MVEPEVVKKLHTYIHEAHPTFTTPGIATLTETGSIEPAGTRYTSDSVLGFDDTDLGPALVVSSFWEPLHGTG